jgi:hypothetical protein
MRLSQDLAHDNEAIVGAVTMTTVGNPPSFFFFDPNI